MIKYLLTRIPNKIINSINIVCDDTICGFWPKLYPLILTFLFSFYHWNCGILISYSVNEFHFNAQRAIEVLFAFNLSCTQVIQMVQYISVLLEILYSTIIIVLKRSLQKFFDVLVQTTDKTFFKKMKLLF